ncbi:C4-dicarboxylate transporter/malic acid transport protein [Serinicoccus hydrothermalis]|uniref:C4-dicarboxylate transporter/malic acid transport protein n=1 Tax=Serinicoccus hydrothermalis TaxID=1758689 RepID=A0A1B1NDV8_9MICO|nr:TDT family transporter [Serinicoccus hydrothermalis]ANS79630.1 C4-dicarboxylate transporter/malic acid transport protein [Serinicoccus hydrothermalis]
MTGSVALHREDRSISTATAPSAHGGRRRTSFLSALEGQPALGFIGPNWFASVMGTGIVANAAATLPVTVPGLGAFARAVWVLDVVLLVVVLLATAMHWRLHPRTARSHLGDPVMSHFYGAPAMAFMTVGAGAMLVGQPLIGTTAAVAMNATLWTVGTALGLWTAVAVPYRTFMSHEVEPDSAFGGWLMPIVPPMVSAATGPLLIPHLPAGQWQLTMQLLCTAMFGLTLVASLVVITLIWGRLARHGAGASATIPTLWIVLGPLGQSITAGHTLGATAADVLPGPYGSAFEAAGLIYGAPMWGFAMLWAVLAVAITVRTVRSGMPFALTWWSFTFPVGTVVTGTSGLAEATGAHLFAGAAVVFYVGLLAAWAVVAVRTARGAYRGQLLQAPA